MKKASFLCLSIFAAIAVFRHAPASAQSPAPRVVMAQADAAKLFHGKGKVTAIDTPSGMVTIKHEAIPGLMDAMEMQFEAKPATILDGLNVGDKVEFTLDGKNWTVLAIGKAP